MKINYENEKKSQKGEQRSKNDNASTAANTTGDRESQLLDQNI